MKRVRDPVYEGSFRDRGEATKEFIKGLKFSVPLVELRKVKDRDPCPRCGKKRLYYCYDCLCVTHPETHPPPLKLPIQVNVVLHPGEHRSKSTSLAAATISPDIKITSYPDVPANLDPETTLVLYPSAQSSSLSDIANLHQYKQVLFVDSTWQQSKAIARDERVTKFKHVRIPEHVSLFWRFQSKDPSYLATVEAIYFFLKEYISQLAKQSGSAEPYYKGEVDDLLLYYINQYVLIQQSYIDKGDGPVDDKKFTTRHFQGYVLEGVKWDDIVPKD